MLCALVSTAVLQNFDGFATFGDKPLANALQFRMVGPSVVDHSGRARFELRVKNVSKQTLVLMSADPGVMTADSRFILRNASGKNLPIAGNWDNKVLAMGISGDVLEEHFLGIRPGQEIVLNWLRLDGEETYPKGRPYQKGDPIVVKPLSKGSYTVYGSYSFKRYDPNDPEMKLGWPNDNLVPIFHGGSETLWNKAVETAWEGELAFTVE